MIHVEVVMSSYNGEKSIVRQLDTIFAQKGVFITCTVRDDGSSDDTVQVLKEYRKNNANLFIIPGDNIGWERSFLDALRQSQKADYYAFSDQDDVWFSDKIRYGVDVLEMAKYKEIPLLYHCNKISVGESLKALKEQAYKIEKPLNRRNAIAQEYVQGCSCIIDINAKKLICNYVPSLKFPHDYWVGLLCYYFGEIFYSSEPFFYHVHHSNNASNDGSLWKSRFDRFRNFFKKSTYFNPCHDLLMGYRDLLTEEDTLFLNRVLSYKKNLRNRFFLLIDSKFRRKSVIGSIALKIQVLLGLY